MKYSKFKFFIKFNIHFICSIMKLIFLVKTMKMEQTIKNKIKNSVCRNPLKIQIENHEQKRKSMSFWKAKKRIEKNFKNHNRFISFICISRLEFFFLKERNFNKNNNNAIFHGTINFVWLINSHVVDLILLCIENGVDWRRIFMVTILGCLKFNFSFENFLS